MEITGIVDRIIFRNAENGYTVLSLRTDSEEGFATLCGTLPLASLGEQLRAEGKQGFKTGEGFRKWTPEEVQACNSDLNAYLIKMLYGK